MSSVCSVDVILHSVHINISVSLKVYMHNHSLCTHERHLRSHSLSTGHVFNMPHDNVRSCEDLFGKMQENHMMSPTLIQINRTSPWSPCSAAIITEFLDGGHGEYSWPLTSVFPAWKQPHSMLEKVESQSWIDSCKQSWSSNDLQTYSKALSSLCWSHSCVLFKWQPCFCFWRASPDSKHYWNHFLDKCKRENGFISISTYAWFLTSAKPLLKNRLAIAKKKFIHLDADCLPNRTDHSTWPWSNSKLLF